MGRSPTAAKHALPDTQQYPVVPWYHAPALVHSSVGSTPSGTAGEKHTYATEGGPQLDGNSSGTYVTLGEQLGVQQ
jgi:hypothetical protein